MTEACLWTEDEDGNWETDCGEMYVFNEGNPKENGMNFCGYCGRPLEQKIWEEREFPE